MVDAIQTDEKGCFDGRYLLIRPLSTDGATADVWLSLDLNTVSSDDIDKLDKIAHLSDDEIEQFGLMVAIKIYRPQNALDIEGEQRFRDEYMIVFNCHHANLIHPTNFSIYKDTPYLVLPYCKRGSSELLIGNKFTSNQIWEYIQDVASGLAYLHAQVPPIVHQDVKPANVLIDDSGHYALTDFGISAKRFKRTNNDLDNDGYDEQSGTYAYMAPERFKDGNLPSAESDIWAFGATLYELLTGQVPFGEDGGLVQPDGKVSLSFNDTTISDDIKHLICACLSKNPSERPTASKIAEAARSHQYPVKSHKAMQFLLLVIFGVLVASIVFYFARTHRSEPESLDETAMYNYALVLLDNTYSTDSAMKGLSILDTLSQLNHFGATFELCKTIGLDLATRPTTSLRKKRLNITTDSTGYFPDDISLYRKSYNLLARLLFLNDTTMAEQNAQIAFILAGYHMYGTQKVNDSIPIRDMSQADHYLQEAVRWARISQKQDLYEEICDVYDDFKQW